MITAREYLERKWDLSLGSPVVWDVRDRGRISINAQSNVTTPNAWAADIDVRWSDNAWGHNPRDFGTPQALTTGAPTIEDLDVGAVAYLVFTPAVVVAAASPQHVDLSGIGKDLLV